MEKLGKIEQVYDLRSVWKHESRDFSAWLVQPDNLAQLSESIGIDLTLIEREWWIVTDVVSVGMYIAHFDAVYLTKRTIYLIMAVIGLVNWAKLNRTRNAENE